MDEKYIEETQVTLSEEAVKAKTKEVKEEPALKKEQVPAAKTMKAGEKVKIIGRRDAMHKLLSAWVVNTTFTTVAAEENGTIAVSRDGKKPITAVVKVENLKKV